MKQTLLLVGNPDPTHVGAHLNHAAEALGLETVMCDMTEAYDGPLWVNRINWWLRGRLPTRLREFSAKVLATCRDVRPTWLLTTGIAPLEEAALKEIRQLHIRRLNYLTDDPWNPVHHAPWFMTAVPLYDHVFSPRRSILDDLRRIGCPGVSYMPFAYAPNAHFPEDPTTEERRVSLTADVVFIGGADRDRVPYMAALMRAGLQVALYGGYWGRYRETAGAARGYADAATSRQAIRAAKVALCLVRRSNRDGHCMRSFELPAIGACMLTEDTTEHREIFGEDSRAVVYFRTPDEMMEKFRWLLAHDQERRRLADAAHRLITAGNHTYRDRLDAMLQRAGE